MHCVILLHHCFGTFYIISTNIRVRMEWLFVIIMHALIVYKLKERNTRTWRGWAGEGGEGSRSKEKILFILEIVYRICKRLEFCRSL